MKGNFWTLLRKYCQESTVLGLKYFYLYPDRISRCFWCANMVAVVLLAVVLTQKLYCRFSEMPTRITIENQYEPVRDLPYPAITLCSPNQITNNYMKKLNKSLSDAAIEIDLEIALHDLLGFYEILPSVNESSLALLQSFLDMENIPVSQIMGSIAQDCNSFLKLCYYEMQPYQNCESLFLPILTAHGLCCSFNNKYFFNGKMNEHSPNAIIRTVKTTGESRGLIVVADYDADDAVEGTILNGGAVEVMYTDSKEFPTNRESSLVETNTEAFHIINAAYTYCSEEVRSIRSVDRKCYFDNEANLPHFDKYSKSDCDLMCTVKAVQDHCHCLLFHIPHASTQHACNITSIPCIMAVKFNSKSMYSCDCLSDFESHQYAAEIILGNFNAMPYMLNNLYTNIKFNKSTLIMNFFFANSMYVRKKQETVMSLTILTSNLGGVFGLCLGCSGISVLELLFYLYVAIRNYLRRRRWQRSVRFIEYKN